MKLFEEKLKNMPWYEKVYNYFYYKGLHVYEFFNYEVPNGIRNVIKWAPVVWKHYDFDQSYLYDVMIFKLELMHKRISESYEVEEDKNIRLRDIKLIINLLKKIREDYYGSEYYDFYTSEMDFIPTDETKKWFTMEVTYLSDNLEQYLSAHKLRTRQVVKKFPKYAEVNTTEDRYSLAIQVAQANHEKAIKLVFKYLGEKVENFWA